MKIEFNAKQMTTLISSLMAAEAWQHKLEFKDMAEETKELIDYITHHILEKPVK